jgi:transcription termination factor Rho
VGTALVDTGSRADEVIFEEFQGQPAMPNCTWTASS